MMMMIMKNNFASVAQLQNCIASSIATWQFALIQKNMLLLYIHQSKLHIQKQQIFLCTFRKFCRFCVSCITTFKALYPSIV